MSFENDVLDKKLKETTQSCEKGKGEGSSIQFELEEKINKSQLDLTISLERNLELERDLVQIKDKLERSPKWITSS